MDSNGNRSALLRFYAAEEEYVADGSTDFGPVAATLHPDITIIQAESLPYGGVWHGHEGCQRWLEAMAAVWRTAGARDVRFIEQGETVVALATMQATARATGQMIETPVCHVVQLRDGLPAEWRVFYWDTMAINRVTGGRGEDGR